MNKDIAIGVHKPQIETDQDGINFGAGTHGANNMVRWEPMFEVPAEELWWDGFDSVAGMYCHLSTLYRYLATLHSIMWLTLMSHLH